MDPKLKALLDLGRISNLPTVWTNVLAMWLLAGGGEHVLRLFPLILGASLIYMAGTTLNDAIDVKFDREYRPERAIPSGVLTEQQVWIIGLAEMGVGALILLVMAKVSFFWLFLLCVAIFVYDFIHKANPKSIYVMGACRAFLYFTAASSVLEASIDLSFTILIWGAAILAYIAGLSLVARGESTGEGAGKNEIAMLAAPLAAWLFSLFSIGANIPVFLTATGFIGWTAYSFLELRRGQEKAEDIEEEQADAEESTGDAAGEPKLSPVPRFVTRLLAGIILIDAMIAAFAAGWAAIIFVALIPCTLILQRRFAAT
jgi:4-hydroxybenzoate polyprenyltransferase